MLDLFLLSSDVKLYMRRICTDNFSHLSTTLVLRNPVHHSREKVPSGKRVETAQRSLCHTPQAPHAVQYTAAHTHRSLSLRSRTHNSNLYQSYSRSHARSARARGGSPFTRGLSEAVCASNPRRPIARIRLSHRLHSHHSRSLTARAARTASPSWMRRRCGDAHGLVFQLKPQTSKGRIYVASKFNFDRTRCERENTRRGARARGAQVIIHTSKPTPGRTSNILLRYKEVG